MLRKLAFIVPVLLIVASLQAQFKKGDKMVGASIGYLSYNNTSSDVTTSLVSTTTTSNNFGLSFSPSIGWFINENVAIGINPSISFNKEKEVGNGSNGYTFLSDNSTHYGISVGGFARYYFNGKSKSMRWFGQYNLSLGLGGGKDNGFQYEQTGIYVQRYDRKSSGDFLVNTGLNLGLSKFIGTYTALDFYAGYNFSYTKSNPTGTVDTDFTDPGTPDTNSKVDYEQKITGHNVVLGVGFQLFLGKRK